MERPKRHAATQCSNKVKRVLEEQLSEDSEDDVSVVDVSSDSDQNGEVCGSDEERLLRRRGRPRSLNDWDKQSPLKPLTPQQTSVIRRARAKVAVEVAESDSDSWCGSVTIQDLCSSDDDSSDANRGRGNSNRRGPIVLFENPLAVGLPRDFVVRPPPKKKTRSRGQRLERRQELVWETLDAEYKLALELGENDRDWSGQSRKLPLEPKETPAELLMPLLPFQKEWLSWSLNQEAGVMKGGILADEMGMGKTIQAIALIVAGRKTHQVPALPKLDCNMPAGSIAAVGPQKQLPSVKATLVICPLVAVIQWRNEIERFTADGSVKVFVYHGTRRNIDLAELSQYDIVLTTYSILECEHRRHVRPPREPCVWCGKLFYAERLAIHLRYYCGPDAKKTLKQSKQEKGSQEKKSQEKAAKVYRNLQTRRVGIEDRDSEVLETLKANEKGKGKAVKSQKKSSQQMGCKSDDKRGRKRKIASEELEGALKNAVETGGGDVASSSDGTRCASVLHSVKWHRIVLDEAHSIKDRRSSTAKAAFALQSEYKWALSGTPLQNRVGELYSLIRFLSVHPYSYYFCRKCDCHALDYQFGSHGKKCECGHSALLHFCWWNKFIANPIKRSGYVAAGGIAMQLLKENVLSRTLLRRTKTERAADLALPPRTTYLRRDAFDPKEKDYYEALYTRSQAKFNGYVNAGTVVNNYVHIFDLLTRLRQAVDHPYLVMFSPNACIETLLVDQAGVEGICGICHERAEAEVTTECQHIYCKLCLDEFISSIPANTPSQCPTCQKPLSVGFIGKARPGKSGNGHTSSQTNPRRTSILNRINTESFQSSTKIDAVREEINNMLESDAAAKAIIFSQFTSMLELIGYSLSQAGIKFVKLDGSMNMATRDQMISSFTNDAETKIFLMSLKAGGVALNLTVASHVFLMDPWWNPAVEQQAQDRIHRIGQFKPIRVIRFVIMNTVEERILKLQEKKQLVFEGTIGGSSEALGKLTEEDLRFLFCN